MKRSHVRSPLAGLVVAVLAVPSAPSIGADLCLCNEQKLTADDAAAGDEYGSAVSVSGEVALIGSPKNDDGGNASGSAYVVRLDDPDWVQEQKLTADDAAEGDWFGYAVSLSGDVALVGSPKNDDAGSNSGSAYVFRYNGATWVQEPKLTANDAAAEDLFGDAVSVSGAVAIIGSPKDDGIANNAGSAYVFRYNGASWVQEQELTADDAAANDQFGNAVAISGNVAVIGSVGDDDGGAASGSAYVFRFNGASWIQEQKLTADDAAANNQFGHAVSISDAIAVIGSPGDDAGGAASGSAYIFGFDGADWIQDQKLTAADAAEGDEFGDAVSISGTIAAIGSPEDDDDGLNSGSAYLFQLAEGSWVQEQKLTASDAAAEDLYGSAVAMSGNIAVIGAWADNVVGADSGSAHLYDFNAGSTCPGDTNGDGLVNVDDLTDVILNWGACP